jgi:hypothetical protein
MGCVKCRQIGKAPKVYRYAAPDGRWRKVETCKHRTRRLWLKTEITRKPVIGPRRVYTKDQDCFILAHYKAGHAGKKRASEMQWLSDAFAARFGVTSTPNMIIGRFNRLRQMPIADEVRATPSLPALTFMELHDA